MRAIRVNEFGDPSVLVATDVRRPRPGPGQVLVELAVSGVNFLDVYQRRGATALQPPYTAGVEGVGVVVEVGPGVTEPRTGRRVGWISGGQGSFAELAVVEAASTVIVPDTVDDETAAAALMQGVTAHYLATDTYSVQPGDPVLVHAAAGGVGHLLTQVATLRGAEVFATVSTDAKAAVARDAGARQVLTYARFPDEARALTDGAGVAVVYDGVGASTFDGSLRSLRPRGVLAVYGAASGPPPTLDIARLNTGGSLYVTRPSVAHYTQTAEELRRRATELFGWIEAGQLRVTIGHRYPISSIRQAFEALESRRTTGKVLLTHR